MIQGLGKEYETMTKWVLFQERGDSTVWKSHTLTAPFELKQVPIK